MTMERDSLVARLERVRHKKRGSEYEVLGIGKMQAEHWIDQRWTHQPESGEPPKSSWSRVDLREVVVYRSLDDGSLWVRPREEFEDGRFERLEAAAALSRPEQVVKALEWQLVRNGKYIGLAYRADSILGEYLAQEGCAYFDNQLIEGSGPTFATAKAAAQADYESRILSCLTTAAPLQAEGDGAREAVERYRLLRVGEVIAPTDEFLKDDATTWQPCRGEWCVGATYTVIFQPMRRALEAALTQETVPATAEERSASKEGA